SAPRVPSACITELACSMNEGRESTASSVIACTTGSRRGAAPPSVTKSVARLDSTSLVPVQGGQTPPSARMHVGDPDRGIAARDQHAGFVDREYLTGIPTVSGDGACTEDLHVRAIASGPRSRHGV